MIEVLVSCDQDTCGPRCLQDIQDHINTLKTPDEAPTVDHEDHTLFTHAHDEQLLLWMQRHEVHMFVRSDVMTDLTPRYPKDWSIPLGNTFAVYGWGHNHRGQLGGMEGNKIKLPRLCESFAELNPVSIVGGEQTLFAITADGKVI